MASKYDGLARIIIQNVGGKANINSITHCVTRLRFRLKDESKANTDILKETDGVVTVIQAGGQYQVVIGNHVEYVYDAVIDVGHLQDKAAGSVDEDGNAVEGGEESAGGKKNLLNTFIDLVSSILQPTLGVLGASGIVKGILACLTYFHILSSSSGTYQILYAFGDGFFYFLPIFLGYTTAKKMKMNEFIGLAIGAGLVYPNMVALKSAEALGTVFAGTAFEMSYTTTFLGIPVFFPASGYTSSVIPVILTVMVASKIYKWARKVIPEMVQLFLVPLTVIAISLPLCYIVIGPVAGLFCGILQSAFNILYNLPVIGGALAGAFVGAIWQCCVIFGLHWGLVPLMYINMATLGYDYVLVPNIVCSWTQVAALIAILMTTKDEKLKKVAIPALISGCFGVTEPAIYGVTLPKKTPFVISCVASAIGGGFLGALGVKKYMTGGMGVFALPCFIDASEGGVGMGHLYLVLVAIAISMVITFVLVKMTWKDNAPKKAAEAPAAPVADPNADKNVAAPAEGAVVALKDVKDEAFASEAMGKGCAVEPTVGKIYAPADGTISVFFPTGHAIGMTTDAGVEVLIHVGIDTVEMNGDGFTPKKKQGDTVKKGELLLEFDIDKIKAAKHEATVMTIITNTADFAEVTGTTAATVKAGDAFITVK